MRHPLRLEYKIHCAACGQTWNYRPARDQFQKPPTCCGVCGSSWIATIDVYKFAQEFALGRIKETWTGKRRNRP
jgi:hypothetical protein